MEPAAGAGTASAALRFRPGRDGSAQRRGEAAPGREAGPPRQASPGGARGGNRAPGLKTPSMWGRQNAQSSGPAGVSNPDQEWCRALALRNFVPTANGLKENNLFKLISRTCC